MPKPRQETYRRRRIAVFGGLTVVLIVLAYLFGTGMAPLPAATAQLSAPEATTQPATQPAFPGFGASAIGAVGYPGVLGSSGAQTSVPIASITKMITSLVILDAKPLAGKEPGPEITFSNADVKVYNDTVAAGGSNAKVTAGMVLSERQAFEAMLLPSANNYSISLAVWAFGSVDAYLAAAKTYLSEHGLSGTSVADTSGIDPASQSTPQDLVAIGKLVMDDPALASIVSQSSVTLPTVGELKNTNKLLGNDGVDGIKTGTTDVAGSCILFSTDVKVGKDNVTLVGAALGGTDHAALNEAVKSLIASVKPGFQKVTLTEKGDDYGAYTTEWGEKTRAVAQKSESVLVWSDTPISGVAKAREITVGDKGENVGSVKFAVGDKTITVPLVLDRVATDPGPLWRWGHPGEVLAEY